MSILIKDMGNPKFYFKEINGEYKYYPFIDTDDDCVIPLEEDICEVTQADTPTIIKAEDDQ